jgi:DNA-binding phage protein
MVMSADAPRLSIGSSQIAGKRRNDSVADASGGLHWRTPIDAQLFMAMQTAAAKGPERGLIGRNIKLAEQRTGVNQLELARRTGMKRQQIYGYEHGKDPNARSLARIALAFGLPMEWFLEDHEREDAAA